MCLIRTRLKSQVKPSGDAQFHVSTVSCDCESMTFRCGGILISVLWSRLLCSFIGERDTVEGGLPLTSITRLSFRFRTKYLTSEKQFVSTNPLPGKITKFLTKEKRGKYIDFVPSV